MLRNKKYFIAACGAFLLLSCSFAQEDYVYDSKGKRDPFIPLVSKDGVLLKLDKEESGAKAALVIEGIIYDKHGPSYAIIGGQAAGVGDPVGDGYRVLKIEENKVIFIKEGQPVEVFFREDKDEK